MHEAGVPEDVLYAAAGRGRRWRCADLSSEGRRRRLHRLDRNRLGDQPARWRHETRPRSCRSSPKPAGINAMLVDATALPEQVCDDVMMSAFRSAGQRCSALRLLYVQEDVADT
jgi:RHH-type proline utilization regulon transcriptional repressor/proline dehydrogenase/delta 1-pyrroline-5-carboxylate dehydrogenase